jgi:hypothetical protein
LENIFTLTIERCKILVCFSGLIMTMEAITGKAIDAAADHDCITIDLAYTEVANAAWKRAVHAGMIRER